MFPCTNATIMEYNPRNDIYRLSEAIKNLEKFLDCTICLELMTAPIKSRCGHSFCQSCIAKVLLVKNATCPLCKASIKKRSISKDDHLETCIQKFQTLVAAIETDCHIDILSYSKKPRDTRESCSTVDVERSNDSNETKLPKKQYQFNQSICNIERSSSNQDEMTDYNVPNSQSNLTNRKTVITLSSLSDSRPLLDNVNDNLVPETVDSKVRTWLYRLPEIPNTDLLPKEEDAQPIENKVMSNMSVVDHNNKSDMISETRDKANKSQKVTKAKKQVTDYVEHFAKDDTSQINKGTKTSQPSGTKKIDFIDSELKYKASHARIRAKSMRSCEKPVDAKESDAEDTTTDQKGPLSTRVSAQAHQIATNGSDPSCTANTSAFDDKQPSANMNWSRVMEFGKEMSRKKKKVKKLDVSTEKSRNAPRIVKDVMLTSGSKLTACTAYGSITSIASYNLICKDNRVNVCNLLEESNNDKSEMIDEDLNSSNNVEKSPLNLSNKMNDRSVEKPFVQEEEICDSAEKALLTPKRSEDTTNQIRQYRSLVQFKQLGTLIRRRNVMYIYLGTTKREQCTLAEIPVISVCNMQLLNRPNIEPHIIHKSQNLEVSNYNLSDDSQDSMDITVIENVRLTDKPHAYQDIASEDTNISAIPPTSNVSTCSTPKKKIDHHLNQKKIAMVEGFSANTNRRSNKSIDDIEDNVQSSQRTPRKGKDAIRKKTSYMHTKTSNTIKLLSPDKDSQLKFLTIDSPMTQHEIPGRVTLIQKLTDSKKDNFFEATSSHLEVSANKPQGLFSESSVSQFESSRKRKRCISDKESFENESPSDDTDNNSSDSASNRCTIKCNRYKRKSLNSSNTMKKSGSNANRKLRLSSSHDEDAKIIQLDCNEQDAGKKRFKRIMLMSSSDTESESTAQARKNWNRNTYEEASIANTPKRKCSMMQDLDEDLRIRSIVDKWHNEHNTTQKSLTKENGNIPFSVVSTTCHQPSPSTNVSSTKKDGNTKSLRKSTTESYLFESNSIFNTENLDNILMPQSDQSDEVSEKVVEPFNNDIISKVLQINRSQDSSVARQLTAAALQNNDATSKNDRGKKRNLLQDNFDEIIANVQLPQSDGTDHSNRPLTKQRTWDGPMMTDAAESKPKSSTSEGIFKHHSWPLTNVNELSLITTNLTSNNSDKENIASNAYIHKRHCKDLGDNRNATNFEKDSCKKTMLRNISYEKEESCDRVDLNRRQIDEEFNSSTKLATPDDDDKIRGATAAGNESSMKDSSLEHDSLMNITQHQVQLQIFEEELFGIAANQDRTKTMKMAARNDPCQAEQRTPRNRKRSAYDKNAASEEHSGEEDDVVENTPETKTKSVGQRSTSRLSSISRLADRTPDLSPPKQESPRSVTRIPMVHSKIHPLYESTPKLAHNSIANKCLDAENRDHGRTPNSGVSAPARQTENKGLVESAPRHSDKRKLCFVCSGLTAIQITNVKQLAQKCDAVYTNQFDPGVTHVIVSTSGEENVAKNTLKYLQGIAHRKWIVSYKWIDDCIREQRLLNEVPYEATTYSCNVNGAGPRNSRLRDKGLFEGFTFLCIGPYDNVTLSQYQDLLLATGATVVDSLEALAAEKRGLKGVVIQGNDCDEEKIEHWYRSAKAAPIIADWIVECICQYKLVLLSSYIPFLSPQDFCAIGYPRELLEDEEYSDTFMQ